jgi:hypothetical protein
LSERQSVIWEPRVAAREPRLRQQVLAFDAGDRPAAREASRWLREESLAHTDLAVTRLLVQDGELQGYYSLAASSVELATQHRKLLGLAAPIVTVPAVLVPWIARSAQATLEGIDLFVQAYGKARELSRELGAVVLVIDPFDDATEAMWRRSPYRLRSSRTTNANGCKRLWAPLHLEG